MIQETGRIIAIEKNLNGDAIAQIECISKSACSSCQNKNSCGVGVVSKAFSDKTHQFEIPYKKGMEVNRFVELEINNTDLVKTATLVYLLPLLFFIVGALLAKYFIDLNEGITILIAIFSAMIGFAFTRLL
ncbi:MAG: SoxR reducing system RseC family protein, partial [Psychromonas sp.]